MVKMSHLNFVDLAGSENMKQLGVSGQRLAETGSIASNPPAQQGRKGELSELEADENPAERPRRKLEDGDDLHDKSGSTRTICHYTPVCKIYQDHQ